MRLQNYRSAISNILVVPVLNQWKSQESIEQVTLIRIKKFKKTSETLICGNEAVQNRARALERSVKIQPGYVEFSKLGKFRELSKLKNSQGQKD